MPPTQIEAQRAKKLAYAKAYYWKNKATIMARYYANPQANIAKSRRWKQLNRERHSEHSQKYYRSHIDRIREYAKRYRKEHPGAHTAIIEKRRSLQRQATINLSSINEWMQSVKSKRSARCYYCRRRISTKRIHFDHIVAIAKGGTHSVENLCVSCPDCNHSKYTKSLRVWIKSGQQFLEL